MTDTKNFAESLEGKGLTPQEKAVLMKQAGLPYDENSPKR